MTATPNVNLAKCDCASPHKYSGEYPHYDGCAAEPVLIPCPIPPSVTFTVRLGKCTRGCATNGPTNPAGMHDQRCPARPIRVTCSISGKTWEESEVTTCSFNRSLFDPDNRTAAIECADRWALVKAILLDLTAGPTAIREDLRPLIAQRDAVFTAIAEEARLEQAAFAVQERLHKLMHWGAPIAPCHHPDPTARPSAAQLAAYVEHLLTQISEFP